MSKLDRLLSQCLSWLVQDHILEYHLVDDKIAEMLEKFESFERILFKEGRSSTDPDEIPWVEKYILKQLGPNAKTDISAADDHNKLVQPLIYPWSLLKDLENQREVTAKFAKLSLGQVEHFLHNSEELNDWLVDEDNKLTLESMVNQTRHPEADTFPSISDQPLVPAVAEGTQPPSSQKRTSKKKRRGKKPQSREGNRPARSQQPAAVRQIESEWSALSE